MLTSYLAIWVSSPLLADTKANREMSVNPFAKKSWRPPQHHKVAPAEPPEAPPLDFTYFGRFIDEKGKLMIFLQKPGGQVFLVTQGSILDEKYRVESVQGESINLRYLPLNMMQTLRMNGGAS